MIDHIGLKVKSYSASKKFYAAALAPLGFKGEIDDKSKSAGFGAPGSPELWISEGEPSGVIHLAFQSADPGAVEAFYRAAMESGGKDNGGPGPRPHYHANYFAAFVLDPDGNNVECVCHRPQK